MRWIKAHVVWRMANGVWDFTAGRGSGTNQSDEARSRKSRGWADGAEIECEAARRAKSWSATAAELLEEAVRMRRAPGVVFAEGPAGRRAVVAGTGLDVWEVIAAWRAAGERLEKLKATYPWLAEAQIRSALGYLRALPAGDRSAAGA